MPTLLQRCLKGLSALMLAAVASLPAKAQLNPKFYLNMRSDFLDLYQQSDRVLVKPEIVTLLDFSGSMNQIMFDSRFPNDIMDEPGARVNGANRPGAQGYRIVLKVVPTSSSNYNATWALGSIYLGSATNGDTVATLTGRDWSGTNTVTYTVGGPKADGNILIRPDGAGGYTEVTSSYVDATNVTSKYTTNNQLDDLEGAGETPRSRHALNWLRAATHARVRVSWAGGPSNRYIDIPLSWTVLDQGAYQAQPPLKPSGAVDTSDSTYRPYDLTYVDDWSINTNWGYRASYVQFGSQWYQFNDTAWSGSSYGYWAGWRGTYLAWIFSAKDSGGNFLIPSAGNLTSGVAQNGFGNGLKGLSRIQAVKKAMIDTWIKYQTKVFWMIRGLDPGEGSNWYVNPQISAQGNTVITDNNTSGGDRDWFTLNKHKGDGIRRISKLVANTGTPLTSSYSNTLVQFMNKTALQEIENSEAKFLECTKHFLLVFTDGSPSGDQNPKEDAANQAYFKPDGSGNRVDGNTAIKGKGLTSLDIGGDYWNLPTLAGVAAHGGRISTTDVNYIKDNSNTASPNNSAAMSAFAPFFISERPATGGAKRYKLSHPIQTMTLGVSLAQTLQANGTPQAIKDDSESPKYRMLAAALAGNPILNEWDITTAKPYSKTDEKPTYFFDATSADSLAENLGNAFDSALGLSQVTTTAMPGFPFVGSGFGSQVYLAKFDPPEKGGPVWPGDLVMFPTQKTATGTVMLDGSGNPLTGNLGTSSPQWSAARIFDKDNGLGAYRTWYSRKLYTRVPGIPTGGKAGQLTRFRDIDQDSLGYSDFKTFLPTGGFTLAADIEAYRKKLVRFLMGADVDVSNDADQTKVPNRFAMSGATITKGVMGDIINSSPAAIEYGDMTTAKLLAGGVPVDSPLITAMGTGGLKNRRFRVIFTGTNMGMLHAFGEVSWEETVLVGPAGSQKSVTVTKGAVDELWAFMPSDFLPYLDYLRKSTENHRYMVDGAPIIYHLDLPSATERRANGLVDGSDEAVVVFGLGKGGRSYYGLDIRDPFNPKLGETVGSVKRGWALVPDESPLTDLVGKMGMSTCQPMFGRVITGTATRFVKDVVFLGGGYSTADMDGPVAATGSDDIGGFGVKLGRSVVGLNVITGALEKSWALGDTQSFVDSGVVPFEMIPNSGLTQRVYFTDHAGKLWALGKNSRSTDSASLDFLEDSSQVDTWSTTPRLVYKGDETPVLNNLNSSLPAPFRISSWPMRRNNPKVSPPVVGIAWVTGDRFDPADEYQHPTSPATLAPSSMRPNRFRVNVVYDRNDYYLWSGIQSGIGTSNLVDFSAVTSSDARIKPGSSTYYIDPSTGTPNFGYYMSFPTVNANGFLPKGLFSPLVFLGVMAYSYFEPTDFDPCGGGNGRTYTNRICNVVLPVFPGNHVGADAQTAVNGCKAGEVWSWVGVASRINLQSLTTAIQSGLSDNSGGGTPGSPSLQVKSLEGLASERFVRPRVWRTVD